MVRLGGWVEWDVWVLRDGSEPKVGSAEQQLRLWHTGLNRVRRPVGGLPFWVFYVAIRWGRWVGADFSALFGFGPKSGGFVVQKLT